MGTNNILDVWQMELLFSETPKIKSITIKQIKVGEGFFKEKPFVIRAGKGGMGYMKKTKKELFQILIKNIKKTQNPINDLLKYKNEILRDYPELLI